MSAAIEALLPPNEKDLGDGFHVRRLVPQVARRAVGPFVFFDHMGPVGFAPGKGLDVRPHPHIGLATVTYLFEGEILHRDSLGVVQSIRPGAVNWMVAGRGIVHSERSAPETRAAGQTLHGIQRTAAAAARSRGRGRPSPAPSREQLEDHEGHGAAIDVARATQAARRRRGRTARSRRAASGRGLQVQRDQHREPDRVDAHRSSTGPTIGMTMMVISTKSRKKPITKITAITASSAPYCPPGMAESSSFTVSSPPRPRKTRLNSVAPISVAKIIAVMVMVVCDTAPARRRARGAPQRDADPKASRGRAALRRPSATRSASGGSCAAEAQVELGARARRAPTAATARDRIGQAAPRLAQPGEQRRADRAHRRGFGRRRDAAEDRAEHRDDQHDRRHQRAQQVAGR
jgi:hypothetical protein